MLGRIVGEGGLVDVRSKVIAMFAVIYYWYIAWLVTVSANKGSEIGSEIF